jgi:hypothetical protein
LSSIPSAHLADLSDDLSCNLPTKPNQSFSIHNLTLKMATACASKTFVSTYKTPPPPCCHIPEDQDMILVKPQFTLFKGLLKTNVK